MTAPPFLITDLDNTLYDWVGFYVPSFQALLSETARISGVPEDELISSFQRVHRLHGTSEYAFALQELDALPARDRALPAREFLAKYDAAIHAFRSERKRRLRLYPDVRETLVSLHERGVAVVAVSDSLISYVSRRLRQLDIDTLFYGICAPSDHPIPVHLEIESVRRVPLEQVTSRTRHWPILGSARKPDPRVLDPIRAATSFSDRRTVLIGDSLWRDVAMAKNAGIFSAWAEYGTVVDRESFRLLTRITYLSEEDIAVDRAERDRTEPPTADVTVWNFAEVLDLPQFRHRTRRRAATSRSRKSVDHRAAD